MRGPAADKANPLNAQGFNEGRIKFSSKDIRFNQNGNILYITLFGVPDENITIKNLGLANEAKTIAKIELLGSKEKVTWSRTKNALEITRPQVSPNNIVLVYRVYQPNGLPQTLSS